VVPDVTWDDIGALKDLKDELYSSLILPITKPEKFL
jgi:SpoVK/Ycf46/Vps4 family AAA+-type ATPase